MLKKRLKFLIIFFLLSGGILFFTSDRIVSLGIVNRTEEIHTVEIFVDREMYKKFELDPSGAQESIQLDLSMGSHEILIRSQTCDTNNFFKVVNLVGYSIHIEYYNDEAKGCDSYSNDSYFSMVDK